jgi:hypothetical protein
VLTVPFSSKRSLTLMVGFYMVEPARPGLNLTWAFVFTSIYSRIIRRYSFSGRWRARQLWDVCGDFVNLKICRLLSEVLIWVGYACAHRDECVYVFVSVYAILCSQKKWSPFQEEIMIWGLEVMTSLCFLGDRNNQ